MRRLGVVASVLSAAAIGVNCGAANPVNDVTAPSGLSVASSESATLGAMARGGSGGGGGGGGKGKPGSGGTGTLTLVMVNETNVNGLPNSGERIRFEVSTTATTEPHVTWSAGRTAPSSPPVRPATSMRIRGHGPR